MKKIILFIALLITAGVSFVVLDLGMLFTLGELKEKQAQLQALVEANPFTSALLFSLGYIIATGISIPGALIFTLAGGALYHKNPKPAPINAEQNTVISPTSGT